MGELSNIDVKETRPVETDNYKSIRPETEMSTRDLNRAVEDELYKAASEERHVEDKAEPFVEERNQDLLHKDCLTTSEERKELASRGKGEWDGETGNSTFYPENSEARDVLKEYGQGGIKFRDGEPDFSKVSEATVQIDDMTASRPHNFARANEACAKLWNEQSKDGRTDWSAREVDNWRQENNYSWHERLDMKTMDLVQRGVHEECKHFGGVSECRRREAIATGGFDD